MKRALPLLGCIAALLAALLLLYTDLPEGEEVLSVPPQDGPHSDGDAGAGRNATADSVEFDQHELHGQGDAGSAEPLESPRAPEFPAPSPYRQPAVRAKPETREPADSEAAENPFLDEENLGPETELVFRLRYGRLREDRPLPQAFDNPHFWKPVLLEEGYDQDGQPRNVLKLSFPGPPFLYLSWSGGKPSLAESPLGKNKRPLACDTRTGMVNNVLLSSRTPGCQWSSQPYLYEFVALQYTRFEIGRSRGEFRPETQRLRLRLRSNTFLEGRLDGHELFICDDNTNGIFGDDGTRTTMNPSNEAAWPDCDSLTVGRGRSARSTLFGGLLRVGEKTYVRKKWDPETWTLTVREYTGPAGRLRIRFAGRRYLPAHLVLGVETLPGILGFVNLGGERQAAILPPGKYFLKWGLLSLLPFTRFADQVEIFRGSFGEILVGEGRFVEMKIGGSIKATIPVHVDPSGGRAEIRTEKMVVRGEDGEVYGRFWGEPLGGPFIVHDSRNRKVFEGELKERGEPDLPLASADEARLFMFPEPLVFYLSSHPEPALPLRLQFTWRHFLLGTVRSR